MKNWPLIIALTFVFISSSSVYAHEIRPGFLQIEQVNNTTYNVFWKIPRLGDAMPKIYVNFPEGFLVKELKKPNAIPGFVLFAYQISSQKPLNGQVIGIDGLNKTLIDVLVNVNFLNGEQLSFMLQPDKTSMVIPNEETLSNTIKTSETITRLLNTPRPLIPKHITAALMTVASAQTMSNTLALR